MKAAEANDTSAIQRLIGWARFRIRSQGALEGATTATIIAAATALVAVFAMRTEAISPLTGMVMLAIAGVTILIGAVLGASKRIDDEAIARRIDRASNLSDRLSTAIAFRRTLAMSPAATTDDETLELMTAAIRDGVRAAPRANVRAATPYVMPRDLRAAIGFLALSALVAGLAIPTIDHTPRLFSVDPPAAKRGSEVKLIGEQLMTGIAGPIASLPARNSGGRLG